MDKDIIKINKYKPSKVVYQLKKIPFVYDPKDFGIDKDNINGDGIKLAILGTGLPSSGDLENFKDIEVFAEDENYPDDKLGYSTMLSGIIASNNINGIIGLAPLVNCYFIKMFSDHMETNNNTIIASILWCIVKKINIVIIPPIFQETTILKNTLLKAQESNINIFTSIRNVKHKNIVRLSPNVVGVSSTYGKQFHIEQVEDNILKLTIPRKEYFTTYLEQSFAKPTSEILGLGLVGGLSSLILQTAAIYKQKLSQKEICNCLCKLTSLLCLKT